MRKKIKALETKMNEFVILGLRMIDGFSLHEFEEKFDEKFEVVYENEIEKLRKMELLQVKDDRAQLTQKGIDFANIVWEEFV